MQLSARSEAILESILTDSVLTMHRLHAMTVVANDRCPRCLEPEDHDHMFNLCFELRTTKKEHNFEEHQSDFLALPPCRRL
jgi:hypothetical protein